MQTRTMQATACWESKRARMVLRVEKLEAANNGSADPTLDNRANALAQAINKTGTRAAEDGGAMGSAAVLSRSISVANSFGVGYPKLLCGRSSLYSARQAACAAAPARPGSRHGRCWGTAVPPRCAPPFAQPWRTMPFFPHTEAILPTRLGYVRQRRLSNSDTVAVVSTTTRFDWRIRGAKLSGNAIDKACGPGRFCPALVVVEKDHPGTIEPVRILSCTN